MDDVIFKYLPDGILSHCIAGYVGYDYNRTIEYFNQRFSNQQEFKSNEGIFCVNKWIYGCIESIFTNLIVQPENIHYNQKVRIKSITIANNLTSLITIKQDMLTYKCNTNSIGDALLLTELNINKKCEHLNNDNMKIISSYIKSINVIIYHDMKIIQNSRLKMLIYDYSNSQFMNNDQICKFESQYHEIAQLIKQYQWLAVLLEKLNQFINKLTIHVCCEINPDSELLKHTDFQCNIFRDMTWQGLHISNDESHMLVLTCCLK